MREEYDFSKGRPNPHAEKMTTQITIRIGNDTLRYFKELADKTGFKYQNLINFCLTDYVNKHKEPVMAWVSADPDDPDAE
jgi:predicted DNA binding CopG/RHH family protein